MYYIIDFFNVFTTFRVKKYSKKELEELKYRNFAHDCIEFFDWFFTVYINKKKKSRYIFVLKEYGHRYIFKCIVKKYNVDIVIATDRYKNIDDFTCHYLYYLFNKNKDVVVISNDKFRDFNLYCKSYEILNVDIYTCFGYKENFIYDCRNIEYEEINRIGFSCK